MARIRCPECRKKISETADSCPKCGYKLTPEEAEEIKKKEAMSCGCMFIAVLVLAVILNMSRGCSELNARESSPLGDVIEKSMDESRLGKHVSTIYQNKGSHLVVTTTFRAKNAFGGMVQNPVTARVSLDGPVREILNQ